MTHFQNLPQEVIDQADRELGKKNDQGKLRWHLLPWNEIKDVAEVMEHGAVKYGEFNWQNVQEPYTRYFNAAMRHILAWQSTRPGDSLLDAESGKHHLAHAVCCLLFLMHFDKVYEWRNAEHASPR